MAEYSERYDEFRAVGAEVAALSVDAPQRAEQVRQQYALPFPILCDTERQIVERWGLFNREEKGGIARPALFLLDRDRRVRVVSMDGEVTRVRAADMLAYLRAHPIGAAGAVDSSGPRKRVILPTPKEMLRTIGPALRLSLFPPKK